MAHGVSLTELTRLLEQPGTQYPVETWQPEHQGDIDIRIDEQGRWFHEGQPISRQRIVKLFSRVLCYDDVQQAYFLVTPHEKLRIEVDGVPFLGVLLERHETRDNIPVISLTTQVGDSVVLGPEHPLVLDETRFGCAVPHVLIRQQLYAKLARSALFDLVSYSDWEGDRMQVHSAGHTFSLAMPG